MLDLVDPDIQVAAETEPTLCRLDHAVFTKLGRVTFRRAETDGTPMLMVNFGEREVGIPLSSLKHAFGISDASDDGRMLGLIAESLDFVTSLQIGDPLPDEVITGAASWQPTAAHRLAAATRLRLQLLGWLDPEAARANVRAGDIGVRIETDPVLKAKVQAAFREAAVALEVADSDAVVALVERLSEELAYIEALRDRLLARVLELGGRLAGIGRGFNRKDAKRRETLTQVQRLMLRATGEFSARFKEIDAQTGEVIATLRNADSQTAFIRSNRDVLYRNLRAWEPLLERWAEAASDFEADVWPLMTDTYQFLARRYLPVSEWPNFNSLRQGGVRKPMNAMAW